jgi:hypothetical protein
MLAQREQLLPAVLGQQSGIDQSPQRHREQQGGERRAQEENRRQCDAAAVGLQEGAKAAQACRALGLGPFGIGSSHPPNAASCWGLCG